MEGFANRLRRAFRALEDRLGRDLTQTELGEMVGKALGKDAISQQSVGRWFAGTLPDHAHVVALAKVLGVDPGWLSYGSGEDENGGTIPGNPGPIVDPSAYDRPAKQQSRQIPTERVEEKPARVEPPKRRKPGAFAATG